MSALDFFLALTYSPLKAVFGETAAIGVMVVLLLLFLGLVIWGLVKTGVILGASPGSPGSGIGAIYMRPKNEQNKL